MCSTKDALRHGIYVISNLIKQHEYLLSTPSKREEGRWDGPRNNNNSLQIIKTLWDEFDYCISSEMEEHSYMKNTYNGGVGIKEKAPNR